MNTLRPTHLLTEEFFVDNIYDSSINNMDKLKLFIRRPRML